MKKKLIELTSHVESNYHQFIFKLINLILLTDCTVGEVVGKITDVQRLAGSIPTRSNCLCDPHIVVSSLSSIFQFHIHTKLEIFKNVH